MTPEHLFFIPTVFFLGLLPGLLLTTRRPGGLPVLLTLGLALGAFGLTHLTELPFGAGGLHAAIGGAPLFDRTPSFSASEVFQRIELFGNDGRATYQLETYTGDVLFPLSLLAFFLTLTRFAVGRSIAGKRRGLFFALPLAWFAADMVENGMIYALIGGHPAPSTTLAALLGPVTVTKFALLAASVLSPLLIFGLGLLRSLIATIAQTDLKARPSAGL